MFYFASCEKVTNEEINSSTNLTSKKNEVYFELSYNKAFQNYIQVAEMSSSKILSLTENLSENQKKEYFDELDEQLKKCSNEKEFILIINKLGFENINQLADYQDKKAKMTNAFKTYNLDKISDREQKEILSKGYKLFKIRSAKVLLPNPDDEANCREMQQACYQSAAIDFALYQMTSGIASVGIAIGTAGWGVGLSFAATVVCEARAARALIQANGKCDDAYKICMIH